MTIRPILFVCTGNICRSPLAEGIFSHMAAERGHAALFPADSAGTGGWHCGDAPDSRSVHVAAAHGIDISGQRARRIERRDFERFALILAMDRENLADLEAAAPASAAGRIHLFDRFAAGSDRDVPDPYYGGPDGFLTVYNMLFSGCQRVLDRLLDGRAS